MLTTTNLEGQGIVADKNQNLWLLSTGHLSVVSGQKLLEPDIPGKPSNVPTSAHAVGIAPLADGVVLFLYPAEGVSQFARLTSDGQVQFKPAPPMIAWGPFDSQGGLWVTVIDEAKRGVGSRALARRLTAPDQGEDFKGTGRPELLDASGCVWLVSETGPHEPHPGLVTIWAPDHTTATLNIPGHVPGDLIVAGPKGQVFIWTAWGLYHCVAKDAAKPNHYEVAAFYKLEPGNGVPLKREFTQLWFSSLGYLAVMQRAWDSNHKYQSTLHLFPAPKAE
jgi:hypothetical protein